MLVILFGSKMSKQITACFSLSLFLLFVLHLWSNVKQREKENSPYLFYLFIFDMAVIQFGGHDI